MKRGLIAFAFLIISFSCVADDVKDEPVSNLKSMACSNEGDVPKSWAANFDKLAVGKNKDIVELVQLAKQQLRHISTLRNRFCKNETAFNTESYAVELLKYGKVVAQIERKLGSFADVRDGLFLNEQVMYWQLFLRVSLAEVDSSFLSVKALTEI